VLAACSLLLNTNADQCTTDRDCAGFGSGHTCKAGLCVRGDAGGLDGPASDASETTCATNVDCAAVPFAVCDTTAHACASLVTNECPEVLGNYQDEHAILFGAILPTGVTSPTFLSTLGRTGDALRAGLALAVDEFASDKNPLKGLPPPPGQTAARPIAVVVCTDGHADSITQAATTHLASKLGVPAIIGSAFSTQTRTIVATLASLQKTDTVLIAPRSSDLVPVDNAGHFVRLTPSDDVQGGALSGLVASREAAIRAGLGDAGATDIKVALIYKQDAYGNGVAAGVKKTLQFNGKTLAANGANFREIKYGNTEDSSFSTSQFSAAALAAVNFKPNAIILVGTNEVPASLIGQIESGWPGGVPRSLYFLSDGVAVPELWDYLATADSSDSTRKRIAGTITTGTVTRFNQFATAYSAKTPTSSPIVAGAAGVYDAIYLLAYSATGLSDRAINGPNLLDGFGLLQGQGGALQVGVGADGITATFNKLTAGESVNLDGASSPLTFDPTSHTVIGTTTEVWCVPFSGGTAKPAILSGQTVDASNTVQGTFSAACGQ
jgi:ABC-type branched-subunit amino acid transport system substrate-binding protein